MNNISQDCHLVGISDVYLLSVTTNITDPGGSAV
jgi:hypothetical protein